MATLENRRQDAEAGGNSVVNRVDRVSAPRAKAPEETFDTPIPDELRARYDAWYAQLPENLQYTGDYDLQGAWLEKLGQPDKYEASQNGHLDDYGKKPNHITFSTGSKWHDPKVPARTGGEWRQSQDGTWDFYPGAGNKATDEELKAYFEKYEKGNRVHPRRVQQDALGGDSGETSETPVSETPVSEAPQNPGGPRIVINPKVFADRRDALCVAFNEAFRLVMEATGFDPVSEPTDAQRKFFSDTAYADDENQLRRTIIARICTFDTSVKDPTDEQLQESVEFLETLMEAGAPQSQWEQQAVQRIHDVLGKALEASGGRTQEPPAEEPPAEEPPAEEPPAEEPPAEEPPAEEPPVQQDIMGGESAMPMYSLGSFSEPLLEDEDEGFEPIGGEAGGTRDTAMALDFHGSNMNAIRLGKWVAGTKNPRI